MFLTTGGQADGDQHGTRMGPFVLDSILITNQDGGNGEGIGRIE